MNEETYGEGSVPWVHALRERYFCYDALASCVASFLTHPHSLGLSLGTGTASLESRIVNLGHRFVGLDCDLQSLDVARQLFAHNDLGLVEADYDQFIPTINVDLVILLFSARPPFAQQKLLTEVSRRVNLGGVILVDVFSWQEGVKDGQEWAFDESFELEGREAHCHSFYKRKGANLIGEEQFQLDNIGTELPETSFSSHTDVSVLDVDSSVQDPPLHFEDVGFRLEQIIDMEAICETSAPPGCRQHILVFRRVEMGTCQLPVSDVAAEIINEALTIQFLHADHVLARENKSYFKSCQRFVGISKKQINRIGMQAVRSLRKQDDHVLHEVLGWLGKSHIHEERSLGVVIAGAFWRRFTVSDVCGMFQSWLKQAESWDIVDELCIRTIGPIAVENIEVNAIIDEWVNSKWMWVRRASILAHLAEVRLGRIPERRVLDNCLHLAGEKEFFIRKALGWFLRELADFNRDEALLWLGVIGVAASPLTIREATRKLPEEIREPLLEKYLPQKGKKKRTVSISK